MTYERKIGDVVLQLEGISLAFGGVKALSNISFDVREHEIRAIIGPNGAGKSSLLNVINGVYHPQQGTIMFRGKQRRDVDTPTSSPQANAPSTHNTSLFPRTPVLAQILIAPTLSCNTTVIEHT